MIVLAMLIVMLHSKKKSTPFIHELFLSTPQFSMKYLLITTTRFWSHPSLDDTFNMTTSF